MPFCEILLVEDDIDDQEIMTAAFRQVGAASFNVVSSAHEAFSYLQNIEDNNFLPRLIITDLKMPGITGYELLQSLKAMQKYQHIAVIVYSTSSLDDDVKNCIANGAIEFFTKPFAISDYHNFAKRAANLVLGH